MVEFTAEETTGITSAIGHVSLFLLTLLDPDNLVGWCQNTLQNTRYKIDLHYNLTTLNSI